MGNAVSKMYASTRHTFQCKVVKKKPPRKWLMETTISPIFEGG